jgi:hypothetical protein
MAFKLIEVGQVSGAGRTLPPCGPGRGGSEFIDGRVGYRIKEGIAA